MGFFEDNFGGGSKVPPSSHHIKWEYKVEHNVPLQYVSVFAKLGNEGWEMCAYSDATQTAMFKRPKYNYSQLHPPKGGCLSKG